jgi:hypothetical protein
MAVHSRTRSPRREPNDVGTLWRMERRGRSARCALMACSEDWELRLVVDGEVRRAERCDRAEDAFALAERWRVRIADQGWQQIRPGARDPLESDRQGHTPDPR